MGQYKVPQNVEAEDHILGPLTFKQFIYALFGLGWGIICFATLRGLPVVMLIVAGPPILLFELLAFFQRDGQNFEQLLLAMVGFFAASRKRIWVKEEVTDTFHVEPPKKVVEVTQRDPAAVRSELEKLSNLIDSRGWNHKPDEEPNIALPTALGTDRIVAPPPTPQAPDEQPVDILDLKRSPLSQNLAELLRQASEDVRAEALNQMRGKATGVGTSISGVTQAPTNDILKLATQSDDLTVSQIAAHATRMAPVQDGPIVRAHANAS